MAGSLPSHDPARAIEVEALTVRHGPLVAVDSLSFTAAAGEVTALIGANGAGKTTTVETLEGYRRPGEGRVSVLGLDPVRDHAALTPLIGVMLQEGGVYTGIRPGEALQLFASYYPRPEDPDALLERVGLGDRRRTPWRRLSGGERQRLSLALALVGRPEVVFLDEPTSGIDPAGRQVIAEVIADLRERGVAVLVTTHELDQVERTADKVVIVDHGRLVAEGAPGELTRGSGEEGVRFGADPGLDTAALGAHLNRRVSAVRPGAYLVEGSGDPATVAALTGWLAEQGLALRDLRVGRDLEDLFLELTGRSSQDGPSPPSDPTGRAEP